MNHLGATACWAGLLAVLVGCADRPLTPQQLRADANVLFAKLDALHPDPDGYVGPERYAEIRRGVYARLDRPMSPRGFYRVLAPAVASLQSGHTFVYPPQDHFDRHLEYGGGVYPLAIMITEAGEFLMVDSLGLTCADTGCEILAVNGEPAAEAFGRLAACLPGERRASNVEMLETPRVLQCLLWTFYGDDAPLRLKVDPGGGARQVELPPLPSAEVERRIEDRGDEYRLLRYDRRRLPDADTMVLRIDAFNEPHWFRKFLLAALRELKDDPPANLVIDLRRNRGGSVRLAELLLGVLVDRPFTLYQTVAIRGRHGDLLTCSVPEIDPGPNAPAWRGRAYVLIGPGTASVATAFAAAARHYGVATLVGRTTGGLAGVYGNPGRFEMPHSKLRFSVASNYAVVVSAGDPSRGIRPDVVVSRQGKYAEAIDPDLAAVLDRIDADGADPRAP